MPYNSDTKKLSLGGGDAEANSCEREHRDQEDGHMEIPKRSQKVLHSLGTGT